MKSLNLGIATRLTLIFVIFGAALLVGIGLLAFQNARTSLQAATVSELLSTAIEKQAALDAWMTERKEALVNISRSAHLQAEVADLVVPGNGSAQGSVTGSLPVHVVADLANWTGPGRGFRELLVLSPDTGVILAATDAGDVGKFKEDQPYFVNGRFGPFLQNPYYDLAFGGATITAAAPILSADGRVLAVLAGHLDLTEMNAIISRRTGLHRSDDTFLVNTASLFATQPRLVTDASVLQRVVRSQAVSDCLARNSGVVSALDFRGVPSLIVYRWLPQPQLCLITKIDQEEALSAERSLGTSIAIAGLVVMLLATGIAYGLARTITSPIRALTRGAEQVGGGNLDYRIETAARDEIGDLARAFNQMTANLSRSLDETAHGHRMVAAVGQAAQAVQRAHSREEVFRTLAGEVKRLGYVPLISEVAPNGKHLSSPYSLLDEDELRAAQELLGANTTDLAISLAPGAYLDLAVREERGVFVESADALVAETLPEPVRPLAGQLAASLGLEQAILAPLISAGKMQAVLAVAGAGLSESDVPAVTALASQAAIALENARLYQETRALADDLEERVVKRTDELRLSEERYRALAQAAPDMVFVIDKDDRVQYVNEFAAKQFRVDPEGAVGRPRASLFTGSAGQEQLRSLRRVLDTGMPQQSESRISFGSREVWLSTWLVPMRDQAGQVTAVMGVSRDITDRKNAEEALRSTNEYLENLFNYANAPIIVWDPQLRITRFNHAFETLTGRTAADVMGRTLEFLFPPTAVEGAMGLIRSTMSGARWEAVEIGILKSDGSTRTVLWNSATLMTADDRTPMAAIAQGQDITERKLAEAQLKAFSQDLERSNKELEQFAYVASHDLQEPLRMVASYVQLLARRYRGKLDADADQFIGFAVDGASRMQSMINDLLALSRLGTRGRPFAPTRLEDVLSEVLNNLSLAVEECGAVITHDPLPTVTGDAVQLGQLFQNLIANAIKFRGKAAPLVHVGVRRDDPTLPVGRGSWTFSVRDNGIGMDPQYSDRVFLIFQRLHGREEYPGTGIGLAIGKKIVERHGGRIWVESSPGQGATFLFTIPDTYAAAQAVLGGTEQAIPSSGRGAVSFS